MIETDDRCGKHPTVGREHQNRIRLEHQVTDRDDEAVPADDDAGAFAFRAQGLRRARLRDRLDAQFDDCVERGSARGYFADQIVRRSPACERRGERRAHHCASMLTFQALRRDAHAGPISCGH